jgi:redox-sensitive bicupin YhaK (pirin superfamily)
MPGRGFGLHPHRDMEIVTCVLSGSLEHRDSLGNGRIIRAGDVQYMSAGTGVHHREFNPSPDEAVRFLQIWIKPEQTGLAPRYAEKSFTAPAPGPLQLVASRGGRDGSLAIRQDADLWLARLDAGQAATHRLAAGRHAWLQVAEGAFELNGHPLVSGDGAALDAAAMGDLNLRATRSGRALLFDLN